MMPRRLPKTLNVYWFAATGLAFWFLVWHTPPVLRHRPVLFWKDVPFFIHVVCAAGIYVACVHNALLTPSLAKQAHLWVGRAGMLMGLVSFVFGFYLAAVRLLPRGGDDATFAIAVTIGGIFQVVAQLLGYRAIQTYRTCGEEIERYRQQQAKAAANKTTTTTTTTTGAPHEPTTTRATLDDWMRRRHAALMMHIGNMLGLFVCACGIPAAVRILEDVQQENAMGFVVMIAGLNLLAALYGRTFLATVPPPPPTTTNTNTNNNNNQAETPLLFQRVRQAFETS